MLNFDPNIVNANFPCQMDQNNGPAESQTGSSSSTTAGHPSAYSAAEQQAASYPLFSSFNNLGSGRGRNSSPGLTHDRFLDHNSTVHDSAHQTPDALFPFVMPPAKGSENVKRFSVNNLLQLAQCTNATNLLSSARSIGEYKGNGIQLLYLNTGGSLFLSDWTSQ